MGLRTATLLSVLFLLMLVPTTALAQKDKPLFLDRRPGEDPSVIDITEVTGQYPKAAVDEYQKGVEQARKGNRAAAKERLEAAIRIEPDFFIAHNSLAILFHTLGQYAEAEREYREAARLNPRSLAPRVNLASVQIEEALERQDQQDGRASRTFLNDALSNINKAFEIQPGAPLGHYLSGVVYFMTGFYEESESHFKKALGTGGSRLILARLALAEIYIQLKEWDSVVVQLDQYLVEVPNAQNRVRIRSVRNAAAERLVSPSQ
jgi:tetratricopeptide (TPR) repeat protein